MDTTHPITDKELIDAYSLLTKEELINALVNKHKECRRLQPLPEQTEYKCTDCQKVTLLEDNGEITVGYCSRCGHPLWNPPQNHDATPFVNKEAYMIKRERVVEIVNVLKYKIKSGAYTSESLCNNLDTFRDEITALPKYAHSHQVESKSEEHYYECPRCGYRMTQIEYESVKDDYACPKCRTSFEYFKRKYASHSKPETKDLDDLKQYVTNLLYAAHEVNETPFNSSRF